MVHSFEISESTPSETSPARPHLLHPFLTVLSAGKQVFKYMSLWRTSSHHHTWYTLCGVYLVFSFAKPSFIWIVPHFFIIIIVLGFETASHLLTLTGMECTVSTRLASGSRSACLCLLNAGTVRVYHHTSPATFRLSIHQLVNS